MYVKQLDETQNRLLLLFAFQHLGKVTSMQMMRFLINCDIMSYMDYSLTLPLLLEGGLVEEIREEETALYSITQSGCEAVQLFENRVPYSRRESVLLHAEAYRKRFRKEQAFQVDMLPNKEEGSFTVLGRIMEDQMELFSFSIQASSKEMAETMVQNWKDHATEAFFAFASVLQTRKKEENA